MLDIMQSSSPPEAASAAVDYGYGKAEPDAVDYGYGDATPDSAAVDYGYGDAAPDSDRPRSPAQAFDPSRMPRRSSLKGSSGSSPARRRTSITTQMEVSLPGNGGKTTIRRRSISFNEKTRVRQVEPTKNLAHDPEKLWFQDHEYDEIRGNIMAQVQAQAMINEHGASTKKKKSRLGFKRWSKNKNKGKDSSSSSSRKAHSDDEDDEPKTTIRGLEKLLTPDEMVVKKAQATDCVLNEQFLQRRVGDFDDESIAVIYKYSTKRSLVEAAERAMMDAEEAEEYACDERNMPENLRPYAQRARGMARRMSM